MVESRIRNIFYLSIFALFFFLTVTSNTYGQEVNVENTAKYIGSGRSNWTVFLVAEKDVLDNILYVEYTLHPSFPNPVKKITDRESKFSLTASGWGEFNILVKIKFKDERIIHLEHWLSLEERSKEDIEIKTREASVQKHREIKTENTSKKLRENLWEWTVYIVADDGILKEVKCVEYTLHPTFLKPVQEIDEKGNKPGKGFFLEGRGWGTFQIRVKVTFKDGDVKYLKHKLKFSE